ncbi:carbamoyltransferase family protein [Polycladidibacter hongkongensis]|uniref:carbamoyltransferase family protein n=1 Tax=Polycladidibacter hongkongensis TaxID=1647556 RepID=UPI000833E6D7|nr:carbamoyltransferase [Pseudovibrio hongkongensis]
MNILGISAFYHDSAACLLQDGRICAAAQEERFTRKKHDATFPSNAARWCLSHANLEPEQIDAVVFYDKPFLKFERLLETYFAFAPKGFLSFRKSLPVWVKDKLFQKRMITANLEKAFACKHDWNAKLLFSEHHLSHAASAFYPSPFEDALVLTADGVGEWTTTSVYSGSNTQLQPIKELRFPHSLGLLYSAFTYYAGFKVNSGEYKLMGLAPYGRPVYVDLIKDNLISIADDGSFHLDLSYFDYCTGLTMTNERFHRLFGAPPRSGEAKIHQRDMDIAASIQAVCEEVLLKLASSLQAETGARNLCLAGGVALNCVANGRLIKETSFENVWIQPASGDAGGALGAAYAAFHLYFGRSRHVATENKPPNDAMRGSYLGPAYTLQDTKASLDALGASYHECSDDELRDKVSDALVSGYAVGWMQGAMEFGPRALGARSIIADPRSGAMQKQLNLKVKYRESFRPFAPAVLSDYAEEWFDVSGDSPYMLVVANVSDKHRRDISFAEKQLLGLEKLQVVRSSIPAVTHVNYSARIQTVHKETNPLFHDLLSAFHEKTGCPVLVNTSFNVRGEPIVCSPVDAYRCFMGTELDCLVIGNCLLFKTEQDQQKATRYERDFELD